MRFIYLAAMRDHMIITWSYHRALLPKLIILLPRGCLFELGSTCFLLFRNIQKTVCWRRSFFYCHTYQSIHIFSLHHQSEDEWNFPYNYFAFIFSSHDRMFYHHIAGSIFCMFNFVSVSSSIVCFIRRPLNNDWPPRRTMIDLRVEQWLTPALHTVKEKTGCFAYFKFKREDPNGGERGSRSFTAKQRGGLNSWPDHGQKPVTDAVGCTQLINQSIAAR